MCRPFSYSYLLLLPMWRVVCMRCSRSERVREISLVHATAGRCRNCSHPRLWKSIAGASNISSRTKLLDQLARTSNVDMCYLLDRQLNLTASIATLFGWAPLRQMTRAEDMAYCLLGLVGINMPMLYGEGVHAFYRLTIGTSQAGQRAHHFRMADPWETFTWFSIMILAQSPGLF